MADVVQLGGNATAANAAEASSEKKWRCDVCKEQFFENFDDACACEVECQKQLDIAAAAAAAAAANKTAAASIAVTLVTQDTLEPEDPRSKLVLKEAAKKPPSPIITPTKPPSKSSRMDVLASKTSNNHQMAATSVAKTHTSKQTAKSKQSVLSHSKMAKAKATKEASSSCNTTANHDHNNRNTIPLVNAIKEAMVEQIPKLKASQLSDKNIQSLSDMLDRLESLNITLEVLQETLIGKVVTKFKKHSVLGPIAQTLVKDWKKIAEKAKREAKSKEAKSTKTSSLQSSAKPHSFFRPRAASSSQPTSPKKAPTKSSSSAPINPFFQPRKKSPADAVMEETKSLKRQIQNGTNNNTKTSKPAKAKADKENMVELSPETTKVVAAMFQNKSHQQIIAEQRRAELAASRKAEAQRERERAAKRAKHFGSAKKESKPSSDTLKRKMLPLAPRFPVPNHVVVGSDEVNELKTATSLVLSNDHPFLSKTNNATTSNKATATTSTSWLSSPRALDTSDVTTTTFTSIQKALFETFAVPTATTVQPSNSNSSFDNRLWTDVHGILDKDGIVGTQPQRVFGELVECIDQWRVARNESLEKMAEKHRKLAKSGKSKQQRKGTKKKKKQRSRYEYYAEDDWLVDDDDFDDDFDSGLMAPLLLLVGPPSSGKTSMVHAVAKHCASTVLEIHTGRARSGYALKHAIEEATQSNSSLEMLQRHKSQQEEQKQQHNFFAAAGSRKRAAALEDSDEEDQDSDDEDVAQKKSSVTIVLVDEVDILFEQEGGDSGFWAALGSLAKATKCPIVLTANQIPPQLHSKHSPCKMFELTKPTVDDCASKLWGICKKHTNVLKIRPELVQQGPSAIRNQLGAIAKACNCDWRRLLQELQIVAALGASGLRSTTRLSKDLDTSRKTVAKSNISSETLLQQRIPTVAALEPSYILTNRHTVVTAKGSNFQQLARDDSNTTVFLGNRSISKWHVVDDTTLLLLCPPFKIENNEDWVEHPEKRWLKRVLPLSIHCLGSVSPSRMNTLERIVDGNHLTGTVVPTIEYILPENRDDPIVDSENEKTESDHQDSLVRSESTKESMMESRMESMKEKKVPFQIIFNSKRLGLGLRAEGTHVVVNTVQNTAYNHKIQQGDVLTSISNESVLDMPLEQIVKILAESGRPVTVGFERAVASPVAQGEFERQESTISDKVRVTSADDSNSVDATWKDAIALAEKSKSSDSVTTTTPTIKTSQADKDMACELDRLASRAHDLSDASFLEDFGDGLPYLSGACRGFAYDHTEDGCANYQTGENTLKMHENSKPPREEKLYALGWKDNCGFYGNAETYMTLPDRSLRKEATATLNCFRGNEAQAGQLALSSANAGGAAMAALSTDDLDPDSVVFRDDLDRFVHHCESSTFGTSSIFQRRPVGRPSTTKEKDGWASFRDEDSYLPRGASESIMDLPQMLRTQRVTHSKECQDDSQLIWTSLEAQRSETIEKLVDHAISYILPPVATTLSTWKWKNDRSKWSYGRFRLDQRGSHEQRRLVLECLPTLRRIGALERCAEFVEEQKQQEDPEETSSSLRRSSRRATNALRRHHYFDKLSMTLRRDEADLSSSTVGTMFADQWQSNLTRP